MDLIQERRRRAQRRLLAALAALEETLTRDKAAQSALRIDVAAAVIAAVPTIVTAVTNAINQDLGDQDDD